MSENIDIYRADQTKDFLDGLRNIKNLQDLRKIKDVITQKKGEKKDIMIKHIISNGKNFYVINSNGLDIAFIEGQKNFEIMKNNLKEHFGITFVEHGIEKKTNKIKVTTNNTGNNYYDGEYKQYLYEIDTHYKLDKQKTILQTKQNLDSHEKNIKISSKGFDKLLNLYNSGKYPKKEILLLIKNKLSESSFKEKINFLLKIKGEGELYYFSIAEVIKSVRGRNNANLLLNSIGDKEIQIAVENYIYIDGKFATNYRNYYVNHNLKVKCDGPNMLHDDCTRAYVYALNDQTNGNLDIDAVAYLLTKSFGKNLSKFNLAIKSGIKEYVNVGNHLPNEFESIFKNHGLIGVLDYGLSKGNMSQSDRQRREGLLQIGVVVAGILGVIAVMKKHKFLGGLAYLLGADFILNYTSGDHLRTLASKIIYGGFDIDKLAKQTSLEGIKKGNINSVYKEAIGGPTFINTILGDKKLGELPIYFKNGKIKFGSHKYIDNLDDSNWTKSLLKKMGYDKVSQIFESSLNKMGINSEEDLKKYSKKNINFLYKKYLDKLENEKLSNNADEANEFNNNENNNENNTKSITKENQFSNEGNESNGKYENKNTEVKKTSIMVAYIEKGQYHLIGKNGTDKIITYKTLSPEIKEKLKKYKLVYTKLEMLNMLINAYDKKYKLNFKQKFDKKISKLMKDYTAQEISDNQFNKFFGDILKDIENNKTLEDALIEHSLILYNKKSFDKIFSSNNPEKIRLSILKYIRNNFEDSNIVANNILNHNFYQTKLSSDFLNKLENAVKNQNYTIVENLISNNKNIKERLKLNGITTKKFIDNFRDIINKINESKKKLNIGKLAKEYNLKPEELEKRINQSIINQSIKKLLFDQFVESVTTKYTGKIINEKYQNKGELNLYSDIKGFGRFNLSDKNTQIAQLILESVVIEAIAFLVGGLTAGWSEIALNTYLATRWAKAGYHIYEIEKTANRADKIFNMVKIGDKAYKVGKMTKLAYTGGKTLIKGTAFYEGSNFVHNLLEGNNIFDNILDFKEIGETVIMLGALDGLGKLFSKIPQLQIKEGDKILKKTFKLSSSTMLEGISLGVVGGTLDVYLDGGERTPEMFLQGIVMALILRLTGHIGKKITIKKINDKIELFSEDEETKSTNTKKTNKQSKSENLKQGNKGKKDELNKEKNNNTKIYTKISEYVKRKNIIELEGYNIQYKKDKYYIEEKGNPKIKILTEENFKKKLKNNKKLKDELIIKYVYERLKILDENLYKEELLGLKGYLEGKHIKFGNKEYICLKSTKKDGEFYIIEKSKNGYNKNNIQKLDDFLKKNPKLVKEMEKIISKSFLDMFNILNTKFNKIKNIKIKDLSKEDSTEISKILGKPVSQLYKKTIGDVFKELEQGKKIFINEQGKINNIKDMSKNFIKRTITGKVEQNEKKEIVKTIFINISKLIAFNAVYSGLVSYNSKDGITSALRGGAKGGFDTIFFAPTPSNIANFLKEYMLVTHFMKTYIAYTGGKYIYKKVTNPEVELND